MEPSAIIQVVFVGFLLYFLAKRLLYSPQRLERKIKEELNKKALELVEIKTPKLFDTGPFPAMEVRITFIQSRALGVHGETIKYRIVTYKNKRGVVKESWVKIEFTVFQVSKITWMPELRKN